MQIHASDHRAVYMQYNMLKINMCTEKLHLFHSCSKMLIFYSNPGFSKGYIHILCDIKTFPELAQKYI